MFFFSQINPKKKKFKQNRNDFNWFGTKHVCADKREQICFELFEWNVTNSFKLTKIGTRWLFIPKSISHHDLALETSTRQRKILSQILSALLYRYSSFFFVLLRVRIYLNHNKVSSL